MATGKFLGSPASIIVGAIIVIGALALIGRTYWGWFANPAIDARKTNCTDDAACKKAHPNLNVKCGANGLCEFVEFNRYAPTPYLVPVVRQVIARPRPTPTPTGPITMTT